MSDKLDEELQQQNNNIMASTGGVLIGLFMLAYIIMSEQHKEHKSDANDCILIGLSSPSSSLANTFKPISESNFGNIYYTLTKIIASARNHIIFPSMKPLVS